MRWIKSLVASLAAVTLMTAMFVSVASAAHTNSTATLAGSATTDTDGSGSATVTFYPGGDVCFAVTVADIATPTAAHIHEGAAGVDGAVVVDFDIAANGLMGCVSSTDAAIDAIQANPAGYYVNVHNADFAGGAIRGQLGTVTAAPATTAVAVVLAASGDTDGSGMANLNIDPATGRVCFEITVANIDAPTAAHIHTGAAGTDGAVIIDFDVPTNGLEGCVYASAADAAVVVGNPAGYYVNVHNATFANGAVRGQVSDVAVAPTATAVPATATAVPATAVPATATVVAATAVPTTAATAIPVATTTPPTLAVTGAENVTMTATALLVIGLGLGLVAISSGAVLRRSRDGEI